MTEPGSSGLGAAAPLTSAAQPTASSGQQQHFDDVPSRHASEWQGGPLGGQPARDSASVAARLELVRQRLAREPMHHVNEARRCKLTSA